MAEPSASPGPTAKASTGSTTGPAGPSLAAALDLVGDRWTLQIVAALLSGPRRFNEVAEAVPRVAPNILSARLRHLEAAGLAVARPYSARPPRLRYELTARGTALAQVIDALVRWDAGAGWPEATHEACGTPLRVGLVCPRCGVVVEPAGPEPGSVGWNDSWDELDDGSIEV